MKKFIGNIILFCSIIISILYLLDYTVTKGLRKTHFHTFNNLTKIYNSELNSDLIINGSSAAKFQISPYLLDSILELNSYNLGMEGIGFIPQNLQSDLYLKYNKKPKIVLQILGDLELFKREKLIGYMQFSPYLDTNEVKKVTKMYKGFSVLDYYIPFIRYYGSPLDIIDGFFSFFGLELRKPTGYKGYFEQNLEWNSAFDKFKKNYKDGRFIKMDPESMKLFEIYIAKCKKSKINIFFVYPPNYYEYNQYIKNQDQIISYYTKISKKYQVPFLNYSNNSLSLSKEYFYDSQHLNKKGAELFTKILAQDIKKLTN
ncbi:hypothetical protein [Algibacter sp. L1A34]|uniref:hypothetical protein n=1 Tax=Algibacter sp. L1A34 TaxID=2686365 RepID=UPI00131D4211|nr:hypothetical protein [Algibacter sp. L1A34]